jgi:hypothetical protein
MCALVRMCTRMRLRAYMLAFARARVRACVRACACVRVRACAGELAFMRVCVRVSSRGCTRASVCVILRLRVHSCIRAFVRVLMRLCGSRALRARASSVHFNFQVLTRFIPGSSPLDSGSDSEGRTRDRPSPAAIQGRPGPAWRSSGRAGTADNSSAGSKNSTRSRNAM